MPCNIRSKLGFFSAFLLTCESCFPVLLIPVECMGWLVYYKVVRRSLFWSPDPQFQVTPLHSCVVSLLGISLRSRMNGRAVWNSL